MLNEVGLPVQPTKLPVLQMAAIMLLASLGQIVSYISPFTQTALIKGFGLGTAQASIAISAEIGCLAITVMVISRNLHRLNFRLVASLGALLAVLGQILTLATDSHGLLLVARVMCGLGEGGGIAIAYAVMARTTNPTRAFTLQSICLSAVVLLVLLLLPQINSSAGPRGQFLVLAVVAAVTLPLALTVTTIPVPMALARRERRQHSPLWIISVGCIVLFGSASNSLWLFYERLGEWRRLSERDLILMPSISGVAFLALPLLALVIYRRARRFWPLGVACLLEVASAAFYLFSPDPIVFLVSATALNALIGFQLVYIRMLGADIDPSGEVVAGIGGGDFAGSFCGPLIGGVLGASALASWPLFAAVSSLFMASAVFGWIGDRRLSAQTSAVLVSAQS
jgi:predicted MFS family arabinose efflux permease